jgi:hypothetical protein
VEATWRQNLIQSDACKSIEGSLKELGNVLNGAILFFILLFFNTVLWSSQGDSQLCYVIVFILKITFM